MSWETMTDLEQAACIYWDMYKDAYGIRPHGIDTSSWTKEHFDSEFEILAKVIEEEELAREKSEAQAIVRFEKLVCDTIHMGANTRETALEWIMQGSEAGGDWEYFCYLNGLPYRYFQVAA